MNCLKLYHGSLAKEQILTRGFDINAPRSRDPGDFGWGIYLTSSVGKAKAVAGMSNVLEVRVCFTRPLILHSPYSIGNPETTGDWFIRGLREKYGDPVHGLTPEEVEELYRQGKSNEQIKQLDDDNRVTSAKKWAEEIQKAGYDAVVWEKPYRYGKIVPHYEVVIFDPSQITEIKPYGAQSEMTRNPYR